MNSVEIIVAGYRALIGNNIFVLGENLGTGNEPIWRGKSVEDEEHLEPLSHIMTLDEILLDPDACRLIFDWHTRAHFEPMMGL